LYFLRTLLLYNRGAQSYEDLCTVNGQVCRYVDSSGNSCLDFEQAAIQRGYVDDYLEWDRCLQAASAYQMPKEMRHLFAQICIECAPRCALNLWNKFKNGLSEDIVRDLRIDALAAHNIALLEIEKLLQRAHRSLAEFNLPPTNDSLVHQAWIARNIGTDTFDVEYERQECERGARLLNRDQLAIYNRVKRALDTNTACRIFVDGPGGTGKTFLFKVICHLVRSRSLVILASAWLGVAASLLEGGRTIHNTFGLTVPYDKESKTQIRGRSKRAVTLQNHAVTLCDEASMIPGYFLTELDRMLQDFTNTKLVFGNKIILFSGDFRQTLPIIRNATATEIIGNCLNQSSLFNNNFERFSLTQNMRLNPGEIEFSKWLLDLGNGQLPRFKDRPKDSILLPRDVVLQDVEVEENGIVTKRPPNEQDLINFVFDHPFNIRDEDKNRAIVCPFNADTLTLNNKILTE
jgi:hypothetical protein